MASMTAVDDLPPYVWSEADLPPPSYDVAAARHAISLLSPDDIAAFNSGLAAAFSHENALPHLLTAAQHAVRATHAVESTFASLTLLLIDIDDMVRSDRDRTPPFGPQLASIQHDYRRTIVRSQQLAIQVASYGERFEDIIIPYCTSDEFPLGQKLDKINKFIDTADHLAAEAESMASQFTSLTTRFAELVARFSDWAKNREAQGEERIKVLKAELESLNEKLADITIAIEALSVSLGVALGITGILEKLSGPAAPIVMTVGAIVAGLSLAAVVGLIIGKRAVQRDIERKHREIDKLKDELETISQTRAAFENAGQDDLRSFSDHVAVLGLVWQTAHGDAQAVKTWLEKGAYDADKPKYAREMEDGRGAVSCYRSMGRYLRAYAYGIQPVVEGFCAQE